MKFIATILANPKAIKVIGLILLAIIVLFVAANVSDTLRGKITGAGRRLVYGAKGDDPYGLITENREKELQKLAADTKSAIYGMPGFGSVAEQLAKLLVLSDSEFKYLNDYYEKFISENTLYYDVDWEIMPFDGEDDDVLARIERMNLKQ